MDEQLAEKLAEKRLGIGMGDFLRTYKDRDELHRR